MQAFALLSISQIRLKRKSATEMPRPIFDSCEVTIQPPNQMFRSNNHSKRLDAPDLYSKNTVGHLLKYLSSHSRILRTKPPSLRSVK